MGLSFPVIVILLLLLGFVFCLLLFLKKRRGAFELNKMKSLLSSSHKSERNNLKRTADLLHDKLQGDLIAIKNFLFIYSRLENENDKAEVMAKLQATLDISIKNTSRVSHQLMPPFLEKEGFVKAVEYYFETQNKLTNVHFSIQKSEPFLVSEEKAYELFRIVEIFCLQTIEDGSASKFMLVLNENQIELSDNGNTLSIDIASQFSQKSVFLSLPSRLNLVDGELKQITVLKGNRFVLKF